MTGYSAVLKLRNFEMKIDKLGFRMVYPRYGRCDQDKIALVSKDETASRSYS